MISNAVLGWFVTVPFAIVGVYFLVRIFAAVSRVDRLTNLAHLGIAVVMLSMPWPWGMTLSIPAQVAVFTLAALWYISLGLFWPEADIGPIGRRRQKPPVLWYHTVMMGAMVWMAGLMWMSEIPATASTDAGVSMPGMSMPGMSMPGMNMSGTADTTGSVALATPGWVALVSDLLVVFFGIAALTFLAWLLRRPAAHPEPGQSILIMDQASWAVTAASMAFAFVVLQ